MHRSLRESSGSDFKNLKSYIKVIQNTLPDNEVNQFLDLRHYQPKKYIATAGTEKKIDTNTRDANFIQIPLCAEPIVKNLTNKVTELVTDYRNNQRFDIQNELKIDGEPSFVCYENQKGYVPHVDAWTYDSTVRLITAITYFNDDYEGGELFFPELNYYITPPRNSTIIFPSSRLFLHGARKVYGSKMICAFWFGYQAREKFVFPWEIG